MSVQVLYKYKAQKPDPEQRRAEGSRTLKNYPSKVPVALGKVKGSALREMENFKLLLPAASSVSDVIHYINDKLHRPKHAPLYLYVDSEVVAAEVSTLASLYQEYREDDYFLYLAYYEEMIHSTGTES